MRKRHKGVMRKPAFCICESKGADRQHLYFRYIDSTIFIQCLSFLNPKFQACCLAAHPDLCRYLNHKLMRAGYSLDVMRQTACLVFNPIMVEGYAALFSCTAVVQALDSMTASM